ncbi:MAG: dihydrodipicolinate synthase family protein [Bryobacteraceae bacterium]|nr:dihydrodipicolinate synthase family protein [Bryobacteraceae bacterium]
MTSNLSGIFPALLTPLTPAGSLNRDSLALLLDRLYDAGCNGVYIAGSTGEGMLLPLEVREALAEAVVELSPPDRKVIVHVGANSTASAVRLATHAERCGADVISSIAPNGPFSIDEVEMYYRTLAESTSLPLLLYFFPASSQSVTGYAQIERLCRIRGVAGLKFTSFDLYTLNRCKALGKLVFNGHDEVLAAGLLMGADGGIGSIYNLEPQLFVSLYAATQAGDWTEARRLQDRVNALITIVLGYPLFPTLKLILRWRGIDCGDCVPPCRALTTEEHERLHAQLATAGFAVN